MPPYAVRRGFCFLSIIGLAFISGCYSMNGYMMNASGQALYQRGQYAMAVAEFEKAVASDPANPDYLANLARAKFKMGDVAGAEQLYRRNLASAPSHQPSYHGLAELMLSQGRSDEAVAMLSTWTATQPYMAESHLEMAWLQNQLGQPDAAAQSLQQALQVHPGHPKVLAHLGDHYLKSGQAGRAAAVYQQSLQAQWDQPEVHERLGIALKTAGPNSPIGAPMAAQAAGLPGWPGLRTAQVPPPMMAQNLPGPFFPSSGPMMADAPPALAVPAHARNAGLAAFPVPVSAASAVAAPTAGSAPVGLPVPDPAFAEGQDGMSEDAGSSGAVSSSAAPPAVPVSHETLMVPTQETVPVPAQEAEQEAGGDDAVPEVPAF